ncbi:hypothetical protein EYF80_006803 [Liparis tanakae]|uniref:Uncharacterized protein n=1 Tax=Liparis tanakae TaxID=230148 RepID=A0A4Z2IY88_9TELE|nr:hypothetical protein EYF80_006803 [Liparis tanakae]
MSSGPTIYKAVLRNILRAILRSILKNFFRNALKAIYKAVYKAVLRIINKAVHRTINKTVLRNLLKEENEHRSETLEEKIQTLESKNHAWQDKYEAREQKTVMKEDYLVTQILNLRSERSAMAKKLDEQLAEIERLELENQVLTQKQQNHESETEQVQQLTAQNKMLEDISLRLKKKNLGFCGRKMQDRDTELDKMKNKMAVKQNKMVVKQNKKKGKQVVVENQEEETSALTANGLETRIKNLLSECRAVEETCQERIDTAERLELENKVLVQKQQSQESEIQQLTYESEILEEICLQFKRRTLGRFGRKMQDRRTELDKMKNKMKNKMKGEKKSV